MNNHCPLSTKLPSLRRLALTTTLSLVCTPILSAEPGKTPPSGTLDPSAAVARVGGRLITRQQYEDAVRLAWRQRFYHGRPPPAQQKALRREVLESLIDRTLLLKEARRRGLQPDAEQFERRLDPLRKRYPNDPRLGAIKKRLQEDDLIRQLETASRQVEPPDEARLRNYYRDHPDKFTEPQRQRLSVILLTVQPSALQPAWEAAHAEAAGLVRQLKAGVDFAELARLHSGDKSGQSGGDMGYLHKGMLSEPAERVIDKLTVGEISDPVRVLRGVAIFRVDERQPPQRRPFDDVRERASALWVQERGDEAWSRLKQDLRAATGVEVLVQDPDTAGSG